MSEESKITKPRMRKGKCTNILTGNELPYENCLTKEPINPPKPHEIVDIDGQKYQCTTVGDVDYQRKEQTVTRKGYTRKSKYVRCRCPKRTKCNKDEKICTEINVTKTEIKPTEVHLPEKTGTRKSHKVCTKLGEKKE